MSHLAEQLWSMREAIYDTSREVVNATMRTFDWIDKTNHMPRVERFLAQEIAIKERGET